MHEMRPIATDNPGHLSVCLFRGFMWPRCANIAERIDVLLGVETFGDPGNIVLNRSFPMDSMQPSPNYFGHLCSLRLSTSFLVLFINLFHVWLCLYYECI